MTDEDLLPGWFASIKYIKNVVIDKSFAEYPISTCASMFNGYYNLENITGLQYINMTNVTDMSSMFEGCTALETIDFTDAAPSQCKGYSGVFNNCTLLKKIYCNYTWTCASGNSSSMKLFENCTSLSGAIKYNSSKTTIEYANPASGYFTKKIKKD